MRIQVRTRRGCLYCHEPFESRMVRFVMPSKAHTQTQFWLHVRCVEAAFAGARGVIDAEDMAIEVPIPSEGEGWADVPDDELPTA